MSGMMQKILLKKNGVYCVVFRAGTEEYMDTREFKDGRWSCGTLRWVEEIVLWRHM